MNFSLKTKEILWFLLISLTIYALLILVFAWLYYNSKGIGFYIRPTNTLEEITFWKSVYFSVVTFHTIGFGDIYPITTEGRTIMIFQSFLSLFYYAIFSGFLVYLVIHRPNDIIITKCVYIRHRNDRWYLSIRLGNKGRTIIDLKGKFEAWTIRANTRIRLFTFAEEMADLEKTLYFDINLNDPANVRLRDILKKALAGELKIHMKYAFIGNNIRSGDQMAHAKYYETKDLRFGKLFRNIYSWDEQGRRTNFRWKNFERIDDLEEKIKKSF